MLVSPENPVVELYRRSRSAVPPQRCGGAMPTLPVILVLFPTLKPVQLPVKECFAITRQPLQAVGEIKMLAPDASAVGAAHADCSRGGGGEAHVIVMRAVDRSIDRSPAERWSAPLSLL